MPSSKKFPGLIQTLRPSTEEAEHYGRIILEHERRPDSALPHCRREAELQLWAVRSLQARLAERRGSRNHHQFQPGYADT